WIIALFTLRGSVLTPLAIFVVWPSYEAIMLEFFDGQTLGKKALGMKVVSTDGSEIGAGQAWGRAFSRLVLGLIPFVGLIDALMGAETAQCARHARNSAVAACERCGAFMCALCRIESDGKVLCAGCFDRLRAAGELESARVSFRSWRTLGQHLSLLGLPLMTA